MIYNNANNTANLHKHIITGDKTAEQLQMFWGTERIKNGY